MLHNEYSESKHLNGYAPYQFVEEFKGHWTPFNQSTTGHVGILNVFKNLQKKIAHRVASHDAACQGSAFSYLQHGASMKGLSHQSLNVKALANVANLQARYGSVEEGRLAMVKLAFKPIKQGFLPRRMDLDDLLTQIEFGEGNVFILTGNCTSKINGESGEGAHCFTIVNDGNKWKFFEALRGEVAFDTFQQLSNWLLKEGSVGALRELTAPFPIEVKRDNDVVIARHYHSYVLDVYQKDLANSPKKGSHKDSKSASPGKSEAKKNTVKKSKWEIEPTLSFPESPRNSFFYDPPKQHDEVKMPTQTSQTLFDEFVSFVDKKLEGKEKSTPTVYEMLIELAVIDARNEARFAQFTEDDYHKYRSEQQALNRLNN